MKTDRRDAMKLARSYRAGDLTAVWVPDAGTRGAAGSGASPRGGQEGSAAGAPSAEQISVAPRPTSARQGSRRGRRSISNGSRSKCTLSSRRRSIRCWITCTRWNIWRDRIRRLEQAIAEAVKLAPPRMQEVIQSLQALRGIAQISAVTIVAELGEISRFEGARQLMGYSGAVPSEDSSGKRIQRGAITKTGNAHLRRIAIEAAWAYRHRPAIGPALTQTARGPKRRSQRNRLEGATPAA